MAKAEEAGYARKDRTSAQKVWRKGAHALSMAAALTMLFTSEQGNPHGALEKAKKAYLVMKELYELGFFGNQQPSDGDQLSMFPTQHDLSKQMKWRDPKEIENPYDKTTPFQ